jgi:hypothetical protein
MAQRSKHRAASRPEACLDTSAFIAFLDKSASYHPAFKRLFISPPTLHTSALVIAEGHGWFLSRYDRYRASQFLTFIDTLPALNVRPFDRKELSMTRAMLSDSATGTDTGRRPWLSLTGTKLAIPNS